MTIRMLAVAAALLTTACAKPPPPPVPRLPEPLTPQERSMLASTVKSIDWALELAVSHADSPEEIAELRQRFAEERRGLLTHIIEIFWRIRERREEISRSEKPPQP